MTPTIQSSELSGFASVPQGGLTVAVIASIFPKEKKATRPYRSIGAERNVNIHAAGARGGGFMTHYLLPAAPANGFSTCVVKPAHQREYISEGRYTNMLIGPDGIQRPFGDNPMRESAVEIANDLIRYWAGDNMGSEMGLGPGIMLIEGLEPTAEELARMTERQRGWFEYLILKADGFWIQGQRIDINEEMRDAARWMGKEDREWLFTDQRTVLVNCPFCNARTSGEHPVCTNCKSVINPTAYEILQKRLKGHEQAEAAFISKVGARVNKAAEIAMEQHQA